jgi:hypothetical protein
MGAADPRRCFRRRWEEDRGDRFSSWGHATYLFQTDASGVVSEQVEVYDDGHVLVYDARHPADEYGALTDQPIALADFAPFEIDAETYDAVVAALKPFNRPSPGGPLA